MDDHRADCRVIVMLGPPQPAWTVLWGFCSNDQLLNNAVGKLYRVQGHEELIYIPDLQLSAQQLGEAGLGVQ